MQFDLHLKSVFTQGNGIEFPKTSRNHAPYHQHAPKQTIRSKGIESGAMDSYDEQGMSLKKEIPAATKKQKHEKAYIHKAQFQGGKGYRFIQIISFSYRIRPHLTLPVFVSGLLTSCNFVCASEG
jgi:hypothetical protein